MYNTSIKNEWKQELSSTSSHLFFCIQSVTLSQSRPENCPQPLLLEISGPGSPLLSAQQICLIHQQHVHLVVWHLLHVWLLAAHIKLLIKRKLNVSTYRPYQLLLKVLLCQCVKQIAGAIQDGKRHHLNYFQQVIYHFCNNRFVLHHRGVNTVQVPTRSGHLNSKGFLPSTIWTMTSLQKEQKQE